MVVVLLVVTVARASFLDLMDSMGISREKYACPVLCCCAIFVLHASSRCPLTSVLIRPRP